MAKQPPTHRRTATAPSTRGGARATAILASPQAASPTAADAIPPLRAFLATAGTLTKAERLLVVDQALLMLEHFYVHRPLKEAMHAVRPTQRLRVLRFRVEQTPEGDLPDEMVFHNEMSSIFISLRDLHTNYLLPEPYRSHVAFLPFMVERCFDGGPDPLYLVTHVVKGFSHPTFGPGVEIVHWNGVPIRRAVQLSAAEAAGSNADARHARGLDALTLRPMIVSLPPDEEWVVVGYRTPDGAEHELRQEWLVRRSGAGGAEEGDEGGAQGAGIDLQGDETRRAKQLLFAPEERARAARLAAERARGEDGGAAHDGGAPEVRAAMGMDVQTDAVRRARQILFAPDVHADASSAAAAGDALASRMPGVLQARLVNTTHGDLGYVRIFTFNVDDPDAFVAEFVRLAALLPSNGLIVDVRANGGGVIHAGERLLQVLTPAAIEPEPFHFINTPSTLALCRRNGAQSLVDLTAWRESIEASVATGATYSRGFPITTRESCNAIGQRYTGPVVLVTDARCYSTTDLFAAGFQDHGIGPVLGVDGNTGAGGANVWTHELLSRLLPGPDSPFSPLPRGTGMRVANRQCLRVGPRAGTPLEDLGVVPDEVHEMTRADVLGANPDLIEHAARLLAGMPRSHLSVQIRTRGAEQAELVARVEGLDRLDFFVDGRPKESLDVGDGEIPFAVPLRAGARAELRLRGYRGGTLSAVCSESL